MLRIESASVVRHFIPVSPSLSLTWHWRKENSLVVIDFRSGFRMSK